MKYFSLNGNAFSCIFLVMLVCNGGSTAAAAADSCDACDDCGWSASVATCVALNFDAGVYSVRVHSMTTDKSAYYLFTGMGQFDAATDDAACTQMYHGGEVWSPRVYAALSSDYIETDCFDSGVQLVNACSDEYNGFSIVWVNANAVYSEEIEYNVTVEWLAECAPAAAASPSSDTGGGDGGGGGWWASPSSEGNGGDSGGGGGGNGWWASPSADNGDNNGSGGDARGGDKQHTESQVVNDILAVVCLLGLISSVALIVCFNRRDRMRAAAANGGYAANAALHGGGGGGGGGGAHAAHVLDSDGVPRAIGGVVYGVHSLHAPRFSCCRLTVAICVFFVAAFFLQETVTSLNFLRKLAWIDAVFGSTRIGEYRLIFYGLAAWFAQQIVLSVIAVQRECCPSRGYVCGCSHARLWKYMVWTQLPFLLLAAYVCLTYVDAYMSSSCTDDASDTTAVDQQCNGYIAGAISAWSFATLFFCTCCAYRQCRPGLESLPSYATVVQRQRAPPPHNEASEGLLQSRSLSAFGDDVERRDAVNDVCVTLSNTNEIEME